MNAAETMEQDRKNKSRLMEILWIAMREEAGWPQPWIDIMYPGYLDRARDRVAQR